MKDNKEVFQWTDELLGEWAEWYKSIQGNPKGLWGKDLLEEFKKLNRQKSTPPPIKERVEVSFKSKFENYYNFCCSQQIPSDKLQSLIPAMESILNNDIEVKEEGTPLSKAIDTISNALAEDKEPGSYYHGWQSNIAMAFVDAMQKDYDYAFVNYDLQVVANKAAKNFLNSFINQSTNRNDQPKQDSKEWEIVERFKYNTTHEGDIAPIKSVKRLSDNEVFTVGADADGGKIKSFEISGNDMFVHILFEGSHSIRKWVNDVRLKPATKEQSDSKVLFVTEDGMECRLGDNVFALYDFTHHWSNNRKAPIDKWQVNRNPHLQPHGVKDTKYFSTKEAAEQYVLINKPLKMKEENLELDF